MNSVGSTAIKEVVSIDSKAKEKNCFYNWHESALQKIDSEYHIIQDGILNKKDYSLIFESADGRCDIPVEATDQINIYAEVSVAPGAMKLLAEHNIRMAVADKFGDVIGYFIPEGFCRGAVDFLNQAIFYQSVQRLEVARSMEIAGIHNIRANIRYYNQRNDQMMQGIIYSLDECIDRMRNAASVDELMLYEAAARQTYYQAFNFILKNPDIRFIKRSKRPPLDEINAMISFANTLLYNEVLRATWKTTLDPRIGIVHAVTSRNYSLNLDFADLFKPIISDRVIFSLINQGQIKKYEHFQKNADGSVYLNREGKRLLIAAFENKLSTMVNVKGQYFTYRQMILEEIRAFQRYLRGGDIYKPYKYW